ncbi:MAG: RagB/SusD family nutrient uptake outer membrane protein [Bacteroidota bacterium]|nr:RagB/SusD family nutrient uptake outer membrane protein [Bacteroidota bacterium]
MMKIKKYTIAGFSALFLLVLTSCTDWLEIQPESQVLLENYWKTETDVNAVLNACYRGLTEDAVIYRMIVWGELRSDNMISNGFPNDRYDMQKILDGDILSSNTYCSWGSFYTIINYCNTLLYYAPKVIARDENFTQSDLNRVNAEALTLRALCYFYLVRAFKDVPYITDASIDDTQQYSLAKDSGSVIIQHITDDLLEARKYARETFGKTTAYDKGRITLNAVNALLADVYLWNQQYRECVNACDAVLADSKLKLVESDNMYTQVFYRGNSKESIFELNFDEDIQKNNPVYNLYGQIGDILGEVGYPATLGYSEENNIIGAYSPFNYKISSTLTESTSDIRAKDFFFLYGGRYFVFKYAGMSRTEDVTTNVSTYRYRSTTPNWIIYRLSDVMLMKAEALVQLGGTENYKAALKMVNATYLRSNPNADSLTIESYASKDAMESLVLRERQRELMFEGKRWFDLVRTARRENSTSTLNTYVNHKSVGSTKSLGASVLNAMYMPISKSELEANRNLVQNPYYEESSSSSRN